MNKMKKTGIILLGVVIILSLAVFLWWSPADQNKSFAQAQRLEGKWVRPDGGYTLVIEDVKSDGSLKASYFNPGKINVHQANWKFDGNRPQLFVELRDLNYPGSKYTLVYFNEQDILAGAYFQAVEEQTYNIKFVRIPEG